MFQLFLILYGMASIHAQNNVSRGVIVNGAGTVVGYLNPIYTSPLPPASPRVGTAPLHFLAAGVAVPVASAGALTLPPQSSASFAPILPPPQASLQLTTAGPAVQTMPYAPSAPLVVAAAPAIPVAGITPLATPVTAQQPLGLLPDGRPWNHISEASRQAITHALAHEPGVSQLLGRALSQGQSLNLEDIQLTTRYWISGKSERDPDLSRAMEATFLTGSGVVRVIPNTSWRRYLDLYSSPRGGIGPEVRYAANEALYIEGRLNPIAAVATESDREQISSFVAEMHTMNLILDGVMTLDRGRFIEVANAGRSMREHALDFLRGVQTETPAQLAAAAIGLVAGVLPPPAIVMMGAYGVYHLAREAMSGEVGMRILQFRDRIMGPDSADRDQALGEATAMVLGTVLGAGANPNRNVGTRRSMAQSGVELAVLRTTWESWLTDRTSQWHALVRDLPNAAHLTERFHSILNQEPHYAADIARALMDPVVAASRQEYLALLERGSVGAIAGAGSDLELRAAARNLGIMIPEADRIVGIYNGHVVPIPGLPTQIGSYFPADTYLGKIVVVSELSPGTQLLRYGDDIGSWFTRDLSATRTTMRIDQAVSPAFGGQRNRFILTIPSDSSQRILGFEGIATAYGALTPFVGGGGQLYIPRSVVNALRDVGAVVGE